MPGADQGLALDFRVGRNHGIHMPIHPTAASAASDAELMHAAFDKAWRSLQECGSLYATPAWADRTRETLGLRIIERVQSGERDIDRLHDDAVEYLCNVAQPKVSSPGLSAAA
jgi:hypothetical protein